MFSSTLGNSTAELHLFVCSDLQLVSGRSFVGSQSCASDQS